MMRNVLLMLNQLSLNELTQTLLLLHLHQDEVGNCQDLLQIVPHTVVDLIFTVRANECEVMNALLKNQKINEIGIDEIFVCLINAMPDDLTLINYENQTKMAYLCELISSLYGMNDNIRKEIIAPLEKIANLIIVKREELDGTAQVRKGIEDQFSQVVNVLRPQALDTLINRRDEINEALRASEKNIKSDDHSNFIKLHQLNYHQQQLFTEKIELENQIFHLNKQFQQSKGYCALQNAKDKKINELNALQEQCSTELTHNIKKLSTALLENMRRKLLQVTQQYKDELETLLINHLESQNLEAAKRAMLTRPLFTKDRILLGKRGVEYLATNEDIGLSQYLSSFLMTPKAKKTLEDYRIVTKLQTTIQTPIEDSESGLQQIINFKSLFDGHLKTMQHYSRGIQFVKVILSILTFGLANHLIWRKTSNDNYNDQVKANLFYTPPAKNNDAVSICGFSCFKPWG